VRALRPASFILWRWSTMSGPSLVSIAVLDDYQNVALDLADWSPLKDRANITVFSDHVSDEQQVLERLRPFDVVCVMRERTPLTREIIAQLPNLKLIASTGPVNASIDTEAASERGIESYSGREPLVA
jgi:phosphoglycerate dehydrogenase-like enzyme